MLSPDGTNNYVQWARITLYFTVQYRMRPSSEWRCADHLWRSCVHPGSPVFRRPCKSRRGCAGSTATVLQLVKIQWIIPQNELSKEIRRRAMTRSFSHITKNLNVAEAYSVCQKQVCIVVSITAVSPLNRKCYVWGCQKTLLRVH